MSFQDVYNFNNLLKAFKKVRRGKSGQISLNKFESNLFEYIALLSNTLKAKKYKPTKYRSFIICEPKQRVVMTNSFVDKIVQSSLCDNVISKEFSKHFIYDNYASQEGKGTHFGLYRLEHHLRRYYFKRKSVYDGWFLEFINDENKQKYLKARSEFCSQGWVLKCDVKKYFYTIDHEILKEQVFRIIKDEDIRWLLNLIIDSTQGAGIPIGNQTSQWFALLYLSHMDHIIKEELKIEHYGRYMDDFYLIHSDKEYLKICKKKIEEHLRGLKLELNQKTDIFPIKNGMDFLGFHTYITESGKVIRKIRRRSKNNARRKLKKQKKLLGKSLISLKTIERSYQSWRSHAQKGNCHHLIRNMDEYFKKLYGGENGEVDKHPSDWKPGQRT